MHGSNLFLDVGDRFAWVQVFGTRFGAVHNRVATVQFERIVQIFQTFFGEFIATVVNPTERLHQDGGTKVSVRVPPVAGTRCAAAST